MPKKFYILNNSGVFQSSDGSKRYICLQGKTLQQYLHSEEGRKKRFYVEDGIGIEIPKSLIKPYRRAERQEQYKRNQKRDFPIQKISLDTPTSAENDITLLETLADLNENVEETAVKHLVWEQLHSILRGLTEEEQMIIRALYLDNPTLSQSELAARLGITKQAVSKKHLAILDKLRRQL